MTTPVLSLPCCYPLKNNCMRLNVAVAGSGNLEVVDYAVCQHITAAVPVGKHDMPRLERSNRFSKQTILSSSGTRFPLRLAHASASAARLAENTALSLFVNSLNRSGPHSTPNISPYGNWPDSIHRRFIWLNCSRGRKRVKWPHGVSRI